ncbi:putative phosphonate metabolism protein [Agrobacterium vitis]|nr:putative phosphonate metabolism protein [Agrobacterium vitis]MBE1437247.1 putative phosphonate metabolism protein [Agrobacterium vitis]
MRYAIYFTPPQGHALTIAASRWLGRDAFSNQEMEQVPVPGVSSGEIAALTAEPRRYGFHATLKAPFSLKEGEAEESLVEAFEAFCASNTAFDIPNVIVGQLGPFFALVPDQTYPQLQDFTATVVQFFERFRAPLSDADMARRKPERLSERQRHLLEQWGYPYVMEEFRFHMTLTGPVDAAQSQTMQLALDDVFADYTHRALAISGLGLFIEKSRGAPFTAVSWLPLKAA